MKKKLSINMNNIPSEVTWRSFADGLRLNLMNSDVEIDIDLGQEVINQIRQALSWQPPSTTDKLYTK